MGSQTSSSLTLRALLKTAASRLGMGAPARLVTGLTPPAKAMFAAACALRGRTLLVVPSDADVESFTADAKFFLAAFEGLVRRRGGARGPPLPLARGGSLPRPRAASRHFVRPRPRARRAAEGARAPRHRLGRGAAAPPQLARGLTATSMMLAGAGYTRQDPVDQAGEFCVRGGVVDFFPAGAEQPVRIEFVGDNVESIRPYDPATQRSTGELDQAAVTPLQECSATTSSAGPQRDVFDYLWSGQAPTSCLRNPTKCARRRSGWSACEASPRGARCQGAARRPAAPGRADRRLGRPVEPLVGGRDTLSKR
jgi:transcription-repair coupling factor (superfamily II helicase)